MEKRATLVCCYNNLALFLNLEKSINKQNEDVDVVAINNCEHKYKSISEAYNSVINSVSTKYVVFLHQDILLTDQYIIKQFVDDCEKIGTYDILGVAGKIRGCPYGLGNIRTGYEMKRAVRGEINGMHECDTVDECFFGGWTECFQKYAFSEKVCYGWHLYAVDRCLAALTRGNKVYLSDSNLVHLSGGKTDHAYNIMLYKLCKQYCKSIDEVATTCETMPTRPIAREIKFVKLELSVFKRDLLSKFRGKS